MHTPPTLATFLDYGGDLSTFPGLEGLAEAIVVARRLNTPAQNAALQRFYLDCVERWLRDGPGALVAQLGPGGVATQATVTAFAWAAECFADPALADRFERSIPCDVFAEHIGWANERRARLA